MIEIREQHLLRVIPGLASLDEALGFRQQLTEQGEHVGPVKATLEKRIAALVKREGR
jgi:hypothetical protein